MNLSPEFHGAVLWHVDFETKTKRKDSTFKNEYLNADSLIKALNLLYQNIKLEKVKISGDTLFTVIKNNEYLGERMGTTGSELYVAEVVINLTSVNGINYVRIDMDERSHASPGVWKFSDFSDFKVVPW